MKTLFQFLQKSFLIESKLDDLKNRWSYKISTGHDYNWRSGAPIPFDDEGNDIPEFWKEEKENLIHKIYDADPHPRKSNVDWMVKQYHQGGYKVEDLPSISDTLKDFDRFKPALPVKQRELNNHTLSSLRDTIRPYKEKSEKKANIVLKGSTLVHETPNLKMYQAHTMEASCELGAGMPWCTANRDPEFNLFKHYTENGTPHYVIHLPNEEAPYRKIGIILDKDTNEFQDENNINIINNGHDTTIDEDGISKRFKKLLDRNPELNKIPQLQGKKVALTSDLQKHKRELIDNDFDTVLKHNILDDKDYDYIMSTPDTKKHYLLLKHNLLPSKYYDKIVNNSIDDNYKAVNSTLQYPQITHSDIIAELRKNLDIAPHLIQKLYDNPKTQYHIYNYFLKHPNIPKEIIDNTIDLYKNDLTMHGDGKYRLETLSGNPSLQSHQIHNILSIDYKPTIDDFHNINPYIDTIRENLSKQKNIEPSHINTIIGGLENHPGLTRQFNSKAKGLIQRIHKNLQPKLSEEQNLRFHKLLGINESFKTSILYKIIK